MPYRDATPIISLVPKTEWRVSMKNLKAISCNVCLSPGDQSISKASVQFSMMLRTG